ncbi:MAG: 4-alpha-glucanotransferase [Erysipelotrichales bacterium]|nr:4-alpha-glucanotransferase [Erysipelotrichales bacterium]
MKRGSGLVVHISSLPSKFGIGNFGVEAKRFVKLLKLAGQKYWQVLPLNPTACNGSPYQSYSSFSLNPYFIDLEDLLKKKYLTKEEIEEFAKSYNNRKVDYDYLNKNRLILLKLAANRAKQIETYKIQRFYHTNKYWLKDYALFMCLKERFNDTPWYDWPENYKFHKKNDLKIFEENNLDLFEDYVTIQYFAFSEYLKLKKYANGKDIKIVGEIPFYMTYDSVDVWAHRQEFILNKDGGLSIAAGKALEKTQTYDIPLYDYKKMEKNNFKWWRNRIKFASKLYDLICLDDFQEFVSYYAVSIKDNKITWKNGPRDKIVDAINKTKKSEIIVKDYLVLTDDIYELIKYGDYAVFNYIIAHFNEDSKSITSLLHDYKDNSVAFMGLNSSESLIDTLRTNKLLKTKLIHHLHLEDYCSLDNLIDDTMKIALNSKANLTLFTVRDLLKISSDDENFIFRFKKTDFKKINFLKLYRMTCESERY